jgi:hypothetical protein
MPMSSVFYKNKKDWDIFSTNALLLELLVADWCDSADMAKAYKSNKAHQKGAQSPLCNRDHHNYVMVYLVKEKWMVIQ